MTRLNRQVAYGADALAALSDAVHAFKATDPMAQGTIIAPNNLAGIVARRHLAAGRGIAGVEVTTLRRLAERIASPKLGPRRPATSPVMAAAWRRALADAPGMFGDIADHPATVRALADASNELRDLSPDALDAVEIGSPLSAELVTLHRTVTRRLADSWYDPSDLLTTATALVPGIADQLGPCIVYLPQPLTRAEAGFLRALADATELTVLTGRTGVKRADRAVLDSLDEKSTDRLRPPTAQRLLDASDSDDEVRCLVREIVETLKTVPAHRVAVLYGNATPYARLLHEQLTAADIAINGPGYRGADERALGRALIDLLALVEHDVARAELFQVLGGAPFRDFAGERVPVSRWERLSRAAGVVAGDDWAGRLDAYVDDQRAQIAAESDSDDPRAWLIERLQTDIDEAGKLRGFACRLRTELNAAQAMTSWSELAGWCLSLFTRLIRADDALRALLPEEQYTAAAVVTLLTGLGGLDAVETQASLDVLRDVVGLELAGTLPRVGRFGEGVLVAPVSAAVGLDADVVYVCGLSEDLFPGRLRPDPLLPDRVRAAAGGELRSSRERIDTKHRHLLAAFAAARTEAVASFPRGDLRRSTHRLPSRFLLPSLRALSGDTSLAATGWDDANYGDHRATAGSFAGELLHTGKLATAQEWRTRQMAATGALDDATVGAATELIDARAGSALTRFDGNLIGVAGLPNYAVDERPISPTALEGYAACPHAFFVERMLRVQPVEQPEDIVTIAPAEIGNLIHQSFENLVSELGDELPGYGEAWTAEQRDRFVEIVEAKALEFEQRGLTGHPRLWAGQRARIIDDALWLLADDSAWRAEVKAAVRASELQFGLRGRPPVEVPIPGGRLLMRGSADKVDATADGTLYVTDIKTGSQSSFTGISQDEPLAGGTKLQLPVYGYAARAAFGQSDSPVHAVYWFVRRDRGRISIELTPQVEQAYATTLATLVRGIATGLFPPRAPEAPDFAYVQCPYCNPDGIGHSENRVRWERKRHDPVLHDLVALLEPDVLTAGEAQ